MEQLKVHKYKSWNKRYNAILQNNVDTRIIILEWDMDYPQIKWENDYNLMKRDIRKLEITGKYDKIDKYKLLWK